MQLGVIPKTSPFFKWGVYPSGGDTVSYSKHRQQGVLCGIFRLQILQISVLMHK